MRLCSRVLIYIHASPLLSSWLAGPGKRASNVINCLNRVISTVNAGGGNAVFLDVQVSGSEGCDNHPGPQGHQNMFQAAYPKIAQVMGW